MRDFRLHQNACWVEKFCKDAENLKVDGREKVSRKDRFQTTSMQNLTYSMKAGTHLKHFLDERITLNIYFLMESDVFLSITPNMETSKDLIKIRKKTMNFEPKQFFLLQKVDMVVHCASKEHFITPSYVLGAEFSSISRKN